MIKNVLLLIFLLTSLNLQAQYSNAPVLNQAHLDEVMRLFPSLQNSVTAALETEPNNNQNGTIHQFYTTFMADPSLKRAVLKVGGNEKTLSSLFITLMGFSVLLLDEDLEYTRTQLGLKTLKPADIMSYMAGEEGFTQVDLAELEASLNRYQQIRLWVGKENMVLLLNNKEGLQASLHP